MADYSIDDILAELDAKKSGDSDNTGRSYGDDTPPRHHDISATAIIARTAYICVKRTAARKMLTQNI